MAKLIYANGNAQEYTSDIEVGDVRRYGDTGILTEDDYEFWICTNIRKCEKFDYYTIVYRKLLKSGKLGKMKMTYTENTWWRGSDWRTTRGSEYTGNMQIPTREELLKLVPSNKFN